jgi:hypothetical protein
MQHGIQMCFEVNTTSLIPVTTVDIGESLTLTTTTATPMDATAQQRTIHPPSPSSTKQDLFRQHDHRRVAMQKKNIQVKEIGWFVLQTTEIYRLPSTSST